MDKIENDFAEFSLKGGLLYFTYKPAQVIDLEAAKKVVEDRLTLQAGKSYPVICDIRGMKGADKTARDYLAKEGSNQVKAVALIVDSPALKFMANFYLSVSRPEVPTKMFTSEADALKFLEAFKEPPKE